MQIPLKQSIVILGINLCWMSWAVNGIYGQCLERSVLLHQTKNCSKSIELSWLNPNRWIILADSIKVIHCYSWHQNLLHVMGCEWHWWPISSKDLFFDIRTKIVLNVLICYDASQIIHEILNHSEWDTSWFVHSKREKYFQVPLWCFSMSQIGMGWDNWLFNLAWSLLLMRREPFRSLFTHTRMRW